MSAKEESPSGKESLDENLEKEAADDDGIANFLSDAIGPDVDVDVFKDMGDADTFAELLEVVKASLTPPSAANSRRTSLEETASDAPHSSKSPKHISPDKNENETTQSEIESQSQKTKCSRPKTPKITYESEVKKPPDSSLTAKQASISEKIKNRLKIRPKISPQHLFDNVKNTKPPKPKAVKQRSLTKTKVVKIPKQEVTKIEDLGPTQNKRANLILHKKCSTKFITRCSPCCVIVYDILKTDKFFQMVTPTTEPKSSGTSINLCRISSDKVDEFQEFEKNKRVYYQKFFNPTIMKPITVKQDDSGQKRSDGIRIITSKEEKLSSTQKPEKRQTKNRPDAQMMSKSSKGKVEPLTCDYLTTHDKNTNTGTMAEDSAGEVMVKECQTKGNESLEVKQSKFDVKLNEDVQRIIRKKEKLSSTRKFEKRQTKNRPDAQMMSNSSKGKVEPLTCDNLTTLDKDKNTTTMTEESAAEVMANECQTKENESLKEVKQSKGVDVKLNEDIHRIICKEEKLSSIQKRPPKSTPDSRRTSARSGKVEPLTCDNLTNRDQDENSTVAEVSAAGITGHVCPAKGNAFENNVLQVTMNQSSSRALEMLVYDATDDEPQGEQHDEHDTANSGSLEEVKNLETEVIFAKIDKDVTIQKEEGAKHKDESLGLETQSIAGDVTNENEESIKNHDLESQRKLREVDQCVTIQTISEREVESSEVDRIGSLKRRSHEENENDSKRSKRRREKDESRREKDKKFERLEDERQRKSSDSKTDKLSPIKPNSFSPMKGLSVPQSFRIPKAKVDISKKLNAPEISSPLSKVVENDVQFKFQCNKAKDNFRHYGSANQKEDRIADQNQVQTGHKIEMQHIRDKLKDEVQTIDIREVVEHDTEIETVACESFVPDAADDSSVPTDGDRTLPPVSEVQIGEFARAVTKLIQKQLDIPDLELTFEKCFSRTCDAITEKCAWWFAKCDKESPGSEDIRLPKLESVPSAYSDAGSDSSFLGNVSESEIRDDDCQVYEISSTSHKQDFGSKVRDPDKVDEYCGRSLLQAKIRTSSGLNFRNLFDLRSGALYEKENFQAKCNLCNQLIVGKKDLATHVRGVTHKENLRKLDLYMDKTESTADSAIKAEVVGNSNTGNQEIKNDKEDTSKPKSSSKKPDVGNSVEKAIKVKKELEEKPAKVKMEYGTTSNGLRVKIPVKSVNDDGNIVRRSTKSPESNVSHSLRITSRSRSRSPSKRRRRTRSRSPVRIPRSPTALRKLRRSRSPDRHKRHSRRSRSRSPRPSRRRRSNSDEHRNRRRSPGTSRRGRRSRTKSRSRSPQLPKKDNREFHAKLALTAEGKWTEEMEKQWKLMEAEEAMFREQFIDRRKEYVAAPEEHPRYATEWTEFWERRYQEVEKQGKDPDTYNYVTEWKDYWSKRLSYLLQEEADEKIREIKRKYRMDFECLNLLRSNVKLSSNFPERVFFERAPVDPTILTIDSHSSNGHGSVVEMMSPGISIVKEQNKIPDRKPSISIEEFKSTWDALTRPKSDERTSVGYLTDSTKPTSRGQDSVFIPEFSVTTPLFSQPTRNSNVSDVTTSSDGSSDFLGFDLVQVLRLMCKTEDQLSFLAPKVLEYYKVAEELELKRSKGSHMLLCNEELVTVLFQARDRFMTMIRSNVLGREILQTLNLTVYGLNAILDAPQCQKFRPKATSAFTEQFATPVTTKISAQSEPEPFARSKPSISDPISAAAGSRINLLVAHLSHGAKSVMAGEIAKYLLQVGDLAMSNSDLTDFLVKFVTPLVQKSKDSWEDKPDASEVDKKSGLNSFDINRTGREPTMLGHDYSHSMDMRITGVSGSKTTGSALPQLPHRSNNMNSPMQTSRQEPFTDAHDRRTNNNDNVSSQSHPPQGRDDDGRRSPFSRRELAMNPVADSHF